LLIPIRFRNFRWPGILFIFLLLGIPFTAGGNTDRPIRVATSIFPVADLVRNIGAERVEVRALLSQSANFHTFEPTPRQMSWFKDTSIFFIIEERMEFWAKRLVRNVAGESLRIVDLSKGVSRIDSWGNSISNDDSKWADPHYWLIPSNAKMMCRTIAEQLTQLDPEGGDTFDLNLKQYLEKLIRLDKEIRGEVRGFQRRKFISIHPAFIYFAREYGLEQVGILKPTPGKEPSSRHVADLILSGRRQNVKVVLAVAHDNPVEGKVLAEELNADLLFLDPLGGQDVPNRGSYLDLMRYNLKTLKRGMGK